MLRIGNNVSCLIPPASWIGDSAHSPGVVTPDCEFPRRLREAESIGCLKLERQAGSTHFPSVFVCAASLAVTYSAHDRFSCGTQSGMGVTVVWTPEHRSQMAAVFLVRP